MGKTVKSNTEEFKAKATAVHEGFYTYKDSVYVNSKTPLAIDCPLHGEFYQTPNDHLQGKGCKKCGLLKRAKSRSNSLEDFLKAAYAAHGDKYDYSLVKYRGTASKITIFCKKHGAFSQQAKAHVRGAGCKTCFQDRRGASRLSNTKDFISKAKQVHGERYSYSRVEYFKAKEKVTILCREHGAFQQTPNDHLDGKGCLKCGGCTKKDTRQILSEFNIVHADRYDYSQVEYSGANGKVTILCRKHGAFEQTAGGHLSGSNCPACMVGNTSKIEKEIGEFLRDLGIQVSEGDRTLVPSLTSGRNYEVDMYLPEHNLAIEYNGLYYHSTRLKVPNYHRYKTDECAKRGVFLLHIFEDDFKANKSMILNRIRHLVGKSESKPIYARKTQVVQVTKSDANKFLDENHVQGGCRARVHYGLLHGRELVAVTSFLKGAKNTSNIGKYELLRHATKGSVVGALGKTLKAFKRDHAEDIFTFCDNSFFKGDSYEKVGFIKAGEIPPDYKYLVGAKREHKFKWRKKHIKEKLPDYYHPLLTEKEMMELAQVYRIYDCGKTRYELKRN